MIAAKAVPRLAATLAVVGAFSFSLANLIPALATDPKIPVEGLQKVGGTSIDLVYARRDVQWAKYKTAQVLPLVVPTRVRASNTGGNEDGFALSEALAADLRRLFAEAMRAELQKQGYAVVDAPRADTVIIAAEVTNIISHAAAGGRTSATTGNGSIAIKAVLADGATNEMVAAATDRKFAHGLWSKNNRDTNLIQVRDAFHNWADILAGALRSRAQAPKDPIACLKSRDACQ